MTTATSAYRMRMRAPRWIGAIEERPSIIGPMVLLTLQEVHWGRRLSDVASPTSCQARQAAALLASC